MRQRFFNRNTHRTAFVSLDTRKCEACWNCLRTCPGQVIGRINLPWHKHVIMVNTMACTGCLKCVKACPAHAICKL